MTSYNEIPLLFLDSDPEFDESRHAPAISLDTNHLAPSYARPVAPPAYGTDPSQSPSKTGHNPARRTSLRPGVPVRQSRNRRSFSSASGGGGHQGASGGGGPQGNVQLISLPQIDAIQRSLKLLDVRLQHVQSNAREEDKARHDVEHIRRVMSENQKALTTVVTVLASIQEEVRSIGVAVHRQQASTFHIQPHHHGRRRSNDTVTMTKEGKNGKDSTSTLTKEVFTNPACKMEISPV